MDRGNSKRYGSDQPHEASNGTQDEASVSGLPEGKTAAPLSSLDAPEDYAWTDGVHTVYRPQEQPIKGHLGDETYVGDPYFAWKKARGEA